MGNEETVSCKHEIDNGKLEMLRIGRTDQVQCLKCMQSLSATDLGITGDTETAEELDTE